MSTPSLNAALAKVQAELPKLERDRTVTVDTKKGDPYSYSYVTLANLSEAILPLLAKHGLAFAAMPGAGTDGKMCVHYRLLHESGEELTGEFPISGEGGIQMIGGRITYARRYCLAAIVGVAADEDDESRISEDNAPRTAQRAKPAQQPAAAADNRPTAQRAQRTRPAAGRPPLPNEPAPITAEQLKRLQAEYGGWTRDERLADASERLGHGIESFSGLTKQQASRLIDSIDGPPHAEEA